MKSILLHVADDPQFEGRLQGALDLARLMGGHVDCLQTRRIPAFYGAETAGFSGSATMVMQLMDMEEKAAADNRERVTARLANEDVPWSWFDSMGDPAFTLVERSMLNDVVVLSQPESGRDEAARTLAHVVTRAETPVLVMPSTAKSLPLDRPVLIAWKPTAEAAKAVRASVPLLRTAVRVDVLSIDAPDEADLPPLDVAAYLSRHGVHAEVHSRASGNRSTAEALQAAAGEMGSGIIVMGGYGRSRAMEFLLGGVTRRFLQATAYPLLMAH
jgi:nucleotide-binding universal stress UspA family protein